MKNKLILFVTIIIASVVKVSAISNYFPLVNGNYWEYITGNNHTSKYQVFSDTLIGNKQYFKYGTSEEYPEYYFRWGNTGKLYAYNNYAAEEYLWFDFSLNEDDTCFVNDGSDEYYAIVRSDGLTVETEMGTFENCKYVHFFSPGITDSDTWYYFAPDVGIVKMSGAWLPQMSLTDSRIELPTNIEQEIQVLSFINLNCYPNPFKNEICISVNVKNTTNCKIEIYNTNGQMIKAVQRGILTAGEHEFFLREVAIQPNIYYVALSKGNERKIKKIVLLE